MTANFPHHALRRAAEILADKANAIEATHAADTSALADCAEMRDVSAALLAYDSGAALAIEDDPDYQIIKRFKPVDRYTEDSADLRLGLVVDTETTGLESTADIIEIGMVLFSYSPKLKVIHAIVDTYSGLEDPGYPIPENITEVTGITTADVTGKVIDWERVRELADKARFAIAHKAAFDRPLLEKRCDRFASLPWACSLQDIPWAKLKLNTSKLDYIAYRMGFFFDGHRAENDCRALLHVLTHQAPGMDVSLFDLMTRGAAQPSFRIWAVDSPYDLKDTLKANGFRWSDGGDGRPKAWYKDVPDHQSLVIAEAWLREKIYTPQFFRAGNALAKLRGVPVETIIATVRYSDRRGDIAPMGDLVPPAPAVESSPPPTLPADQVCHPATGEQPPLPSQPDLWGSAPAKDRSPRP